MNVKILTAVIIVASISLVGFLSIKSSGSKTTTGDSTYHNNSNDGKRVSDLHNLGITLNLYYSDHQYYPKDLQTTFNCKELEKSANQNGELPASTDVSARIICHSYDPDTNQRYQYMPLDCDNQDRCKKYMLITEIKGQLFLKDATWSQKDCNFGSGSQYIYCSK